MRSIAIGHKISLKTQKQESQYRIYCKKKYKAQHKPSLNFGARSHKVKNLNRTNSIIYTLLQI